MQVRIATSLLAWYMRHCGFIGWASFWNTVYVMPGWESYQPLLRHERKHLEHIKNDGRILLALKYLWWTLRHGYYMNPYEVEARAAESRSP